MQKRIKITLFTENLPKNTDEMINDIGTWVDKNIFKARYPRQMKTVDHRLNRLIQYSEQKGYDLNIVNQIVMQIFDQFNPTAPPNFTKH